MAKLEFRKFQELLQSANEVRPDINRIDYLYLKWLSPESLLKFIEDQAVKGNSYTEKGVKVFSATQLISDLVVELRGALPVKEESHLSFEERLNTMPVEVTQEFIRQLRREGKSYEASQLLKAFHKSKLNDKIEGRKINASINNKIWRIRALRYKKQEGNGGSYHG